MGIQSPLKKAKGLGSAKSGSHHWWMQRISAVALIPLAIWFVVIVINTTVNDVSIVSILGSPMNTVLMILFFAATLYHGTLGLQVVIEDYVHCPCGKVFWLVAIKFVSIITAVAGILALITFHVNHVGLTSVIV